MTPEEREILSPYQDKVKAILGASQTGNESLKKELKEKLKARGADQKDLAEEARNARAKSGEDHLIIRASLEFSNHCKQVCSFCGMSSFNKELERYQMSENQIASVIEGVSLLGINELHLASGEDWNFKAESISNIISGAVQKNMNITLVTSHRRLADYKILKDAGANRYILKVETTNPQLFKDARTGTHLPTRVAHLLYLRDIGFKIGSGIICGLPNQTVDDLVNDLFFFKELQPDMASVSRFLPNFQSRYANLHEGDPDLTLNFLSILRIELSQSGLRIPAGTTLGRRQADAINHGANVVSLHVTPEEYAEQYSADLVNERTLTKMQNIRELSNETGMPLILHIN